MILSFIISAGLFFLFTTYLYNARWALVLLPVYSIAYILFINFENLVGYRVCDWLCHKIPHFSQKEDLCHDEKK